MSRFTRIQVFEQMKSGGLVPLFYHYDVAIAKEILCACYNGGARVIEFTNRGVNAHEVFAELYKYATQHLPELILGVGSVTNAGTASLYMQVGAGFVVTPVLREDIAIVCNRKKVLWSPGCGSLGEIAKAEEMGCELIKLFPGGIYGPAFVKAVLGPQPWTCIMPTGGVSPTRENLEAWFSAGVTCVGMGSKLISKELVSAQEFDKLEDRVRECLKMISELRATI